MPKTDDAKQRRDERDPHGEADTVLPFGQVPRPKYETPQDQLEDVPYERSDDPEAVKR